MTINAITLFISTFLLVFALGMQSQLVNNGHAISAFCNSLMIGTFQLTLIKLGATATGWEVAAFICGGPFGIVFSMYVFRRWFRRKNVTQ